MKKFLTLCFLPFLLLCSLVLSAQPCNISGIYSIGPGGAYTTLTAALNFLRTTGTGGAVVLELRPDYTSTAETFPIEFGSIPCVSAINTITVRPAAGATNLSISSNFNGTTINLSNARYITIDGRPGGIGNSTQLTIRNATPGSAVNSGGAVITFSNDASYNTIQYLNIKGVAYGSSYNPVKGLISFLGSTASVTNGNTDNLITNCNLGDSLQLSYTSIFSQGDAGKKNRNNKISNCLVFNYFKTDVLGSMNGVYLGSNNESWEIAGNSFFQTAARNYAANINIAININDTTSSGFWIHDNFIGGTAAFCSGAPLDYTSAFKGISIAASAGNYSIIENNTISNIKWRTYSSMPGFTGISMLKGKINCTGNLVGSMLQRSSIVTTSSYLDNAPVSAILINEDDIFPQSITDSFFIKNNRIGGILLQRDPTNYITTTFTGIGGSLVRAYALVANNIIGSTTVEKSIETVDEKLTGINFGAHSPDNGGNYNNPLRFDITGNQANHWYGNSTFISVRGGAAQITNNAFRNIVGDNKSLQGVYALACLSGTLVSGNSFNSLQTKGTQPSVISAIDLDRCQGVTISNNFIHSFHSETPRATFQGIQVVPQSNGSGGNYNIQNNFISLGPDTTSSASILDLQGITVSTDNSTVSNNSVYIGGSGNTESSSYAIQLNDEFRIFTVRNRIINNILQNNRSGAAAFPLINIVYTITDTAKLQIDNNIYHYPASGGILGRWRGGNYNTLRQWRAALKLDSSSVFGNPNFINPEGNTSTINLHLTNPTPAEGQGLFDASVTTDFDGDLRSNFTPTDIGADAGNFVLLDVDTPTLFHPAYTYQTTGSVYSYKVKITDNGSGIDSTGNNKPRMWFRRTYPSTSAWLSIPGNLTAGNLKKGEWTFSPNFTAAGLILNAGDSVAFYFVAQDKSIPAKVGYSGIDITSHNTVNIQLTAPLRPNRLFIYGQFPDTVYAGAGQLYTSLTGTGGFFQASQTFKFDPAKQHVYVIITSDLQESQTHYNYSPPADTFQTIHFITNTPVVKRIQNNSTYSGPLLNFNNTVNLRIDGSVNNSGRYLQFINASAFTPPGIGSTISIGGITNKIHIENCLFNSNQQSSLGMISVYTPVIEKLLLKGNVFSSATGFTGYPSLQVNIYCSNSDSILITDNDFANFSQYGIYMNIGATVIPEYGKIIIDNNHFYQQTSLPANTTNAVYIGATKSPVSITNNYIGGSARNCAGTWYQLNSSLRGIYLAASADSISSIQNNTIRNIRMGGSGGTLTGIYLDGGMFNIGNIAGNHIGGGTADTSLYASTFTGIQCNNASSGSVMNNQISKVVTVVFKGIDCMVRNGSIKNNNINTCFSSVNGSFVTPSFIGIKAFLDTGLVEANTIHHLYKKLAATGDCYGIDAMPYGGDGEFVIARNVVNNLQSAGGTILAGIRAGKSRFNIHNNLINLSNDSIPNDVALRGLYMYSSTTLAKFTRIHYNSIRLYGNPAGTKKTHAVYIDGGSPVTSFRNNLLYNQCTGGSARHIALGMLATPDIWTPGVAGNNLYITADTGYINEWRTNGPVTVNNWKQLSGGDGNSFFNTTGRIPADSFFISTANNDLHINTASPFCWYVNDKGRAISDISGDIDVASGTRSVDTVNGKTDIGADEFTSNAPLPVLPLSFCAGGTQILSSNATALSYQWQLNTGSGFGNLSDNANYSGTNSANLTLTNIPSSWYGYQFRCMADALITGTASLEFANNWTGAVNSDWFLPGNWSCNVVPDGNTDVIIASGTVVLNQNGICRSITVRPAATFTINNNAVLTITH